jgi:endonuclease/exonuclease/phosphatase family metal-dependent hydrolase
MNATMSKLGKFLRSICMLLNIGAILWLVLCLIASYYDTSTQASFMSLFSFTCFFAVAANLFFIFIWLVSQKKIRALCSIITLVVCWKVVKPSFAINLFASNNVSSIENNGLKIMTWNVHMFDLGEWTKDNTTIGKILNFIETENPDILCLQEYYRDTNNHKEPFTDIIQKIGYGYHSFLLNNQWLKNKMNTKAAKEEVIDVGTMIFSKYPIENVRTYPSPDDGQGFQLVDITLQNNKKFSLLVVHLTSVRFGNKEFGYLQDVKNNAVDEQNKSKYLANKLMYASSVRAKVANAVAKFSAEANYPLVICGDFNDMPGSYVYNTVKGDLNDAFVAKGWGLGSTYQKIIPILRIDYLLYDKQLFKVEGYKKYPTELSDHNPIMVNLSIK